MKSVTIAVMLLVIVGLTTHVHAATVAAYDFENGYVNTGTGTVAGQARGGAGIIFDAGGGLKGASNVLLLDGSGDYVEVGNGDIGGITSVITVAAWVKSSANNWSSHDSIVTRGYNWRLYVSGSKDGTFQAMDTTPSGSKVRGTVDINDEQWHHLAGVYDGAFYTFYVDGVQDGAAVAATGPIAQTLSHKFTIGAFESSGAVSKYYTGLIDEVRVYDEALGAADIRALVPEPATIALLLTGGGLLIRRRRRQEDKK
ncbi:MAG: LamG domain-containing protein [Planctomycetes bacterium]|nr:LamG domain-containing protein [Planctomycetota bacterium]